MARDTPQTDPLSPAVEIYFLGQIDFGHCLALQEQLLHNAAQRIDGRIDLLLCEHPSIVTVGRGGSPVDIQLDAKPIQSGQIEVQWVKRGGGCMVHTLGQLAIYPIVPLAWHGFSVGQYLDRFQAGIVETLKELEIRTHTYDDRHGIGSRTGELVSFGIGVRDNITYHGAFINVCPPMGLIRLVHSCCSEIERTSCLLAERRQAARMPTVRAALVQHLTKAFGCERYHLYTGHPSLRPRASRPMPDLM